MLARHRHAFVTEAKRAAKILLLVACFGRGEGAPKSEATVFAQASGAFLDHLSERFASETNETFVLLDDHFSLDFSKVTGSPKTESRIRETGLKILEEGAGLDQAVAQEVFGVLTSQEEIGPKLANATKGEPHTQETEWISVVRLSNIWISEVENEQLVVAYQVEYPDKSGESRLVSIQKEKGQWIVSGLLVAIRD